MKKAILTVAALLLIGVGQASAQSYSREGKTFVQKSSRKAGEAKLTGYTWRDSKGNEYPIYQSPSGACYVLRVSKKTGNEYKQYLGKEISAEIARLTGVEYKPKK